MKKRKSGMAPRSKWALPALTVGVILWGLHLAYKRRQAAAASVAAVNVINPANLNPAANGNQAMAAPTDQELHYVK